MTKTVDVTSEVLSLKISKNSREALRALAFKAGHSSKGRVVKDILEKDPAFMAELKKIKNTSK